METLYVNLFGGPSVGKSTNAARIFAMLKEHGVNAEYISEYAKDKTWSQDYNTLKCQPYVTGKQFYKNFRLMGAVDVAVTDSPCMIGVLYQGFGCTPSWEKWVIESFNLFNNLNILLVRNSEAHPFNPKGRSQTEDQCKELDLKIKDILDKYQIPYHCIEVGSSTAQQIFDLVIDTITGSAIKYL